MNGVYEGKKRVWLKSFMSPSWIFHNISRQLEALPLFLVSIVVKVDFVCPVAEFCRKHGPNLRSNPAEFFDEENFIEV